jgi:excisionase family DNA binding protein
MPVRDRQSIDAQDDLPIWQRIMRIKRALKVKELAEMIGLCVRQVYDLIGSGTLPAYRLGGAIRLDPVIVGAWLRDRQQ